MKSEDRRSFIKKSMVVTAGVSLGAPAFIKGYAQTKPVINQRSCCRSQQPWKGRNTILYQD